MKIVVLVKPVPDINRVRFDAERGRVIREGVPLEENPFDLHALELALKIKDSIGAEVIVLGMAPPQGERALRDCLARGADRAILLSDIAFAGSDTFATSLALSNAIRKLGRVDLILCGEKTTDGDTGQVGPEVASMLSLPFLPNLCELKKISPKEIKGVCDLGDKYLAKTSLPAVISVKKELNVPRLPTLRRKVKSFEEKVEVWRASDIGGGPYGLKGSKTSVVKVTIPKEEGRKGVVLDVKEGVRVLLSILSSIRGEV